MSNSHFDFKRFHIEQDMCAMKVGTDGVLLGSWAECPDAASTILDVGTGTGIVALMMAQRFVTANVTAIDIDKSATEQAKSNAADSPFADRIGVEHTSLQDMSRTGARFDAIVCNPPYFHDSLTSPDQQRAIARHAITLTTKDIATASAMLLNEGGLLSVILPYAEHERMEAECSFVGLFLNRRCAVKTSERKPPSRMLMSFTNRPCADMECTSMTIGDDEYQRQTECFYMGQ